MHTWLCQIQASCRHRSVCKFCLTQGPLRFDCRDCRTSLRGFPEKCGLIVAPFAAAMTYGGLRQVSELYRETCAKHGVKPGRLMCSYFMHFTDDDARSTRRGHDRSATSRSAPSLPYPGSGDRSAKFRYFVAMGTVAQDAAGKSTAGK